MKPPVTRKGKTHKVSIGPVTAYFTVNRDDEGRIVEVFAKSDNGSQGHLDMACRLASLGIQGRADVKTLVRHMKGDKTEPMGGPGQPSSIYDALSRVLEREMGDEPKP